MFLDLFSGDNFFTGSFIEYLFPMKSIQEHLRQLLQTVPTSNMLQSPLCIVALYEHSKQSANKPSPRCQSKRHIALPLFNY